MLGHSVLSFSLKDETIFLKTLGGGDAEAGVHVKVWAVDRVLMVWLCSFNTCWVELGKKEACRVVAAGFEIRRLWCLICRGNYGMGYM
jgi:hypothetical protein